MPALICDERIAEAYQVDQTTQGYLRTLLKNSYNIVVD